MASRFSGVSGPVASCLASASEICLAAARAAGLPALVRLPISLRACASGISSPGPDRVSAGFRPRQSLVQNDDAGSFNRAV
jgi:hypothetical protein